MLGCFGNFEIMIIWNAMERMPHALYTKYTYNTQSRVVDINIFELNPKSTTTKYNKTINTFSLIII